MFVPKRQNLSQAPHTDGTPTTRKKNEMTDIKTVTTQEELDAALAAGIIDLLIDRPDGATPLDIENKKVRLRGNSSAILRGNARDHFPDATRFLEVTCDAATFIPIDTSKIKTAQAYVLREVDICGTPLKEDK